jgi:hypothetical protein
LLSFLLGLKVYNSAKSLKSKNALTYLTP